MQYTIYSSMKKHEHFMSNKKKTDCSGTLAKSKNTENLIFEYYLGNFVYDSI